VRFVTGKCCVFVFAVRVIEKLSRPVTCNIIKVDQFDPNDLCGEELFHLLGENTVGAPTRLKGSTAKTLYQRIQAMDVESMTRSEYEAAIGPAPAGNLVVPAPEVADPFQGMELGVDEPAPEQVAEEPVPEVVGSDVEEVPDVPAVGPGQVVVHKEDLQVVREHLQFCNTAVDALEAGKRIPAQPASRGKYVTISQARAAPLAVGRKLSQATALGLLYGCSVCNKKFGSKSSQQKHLSVHRGKAGIFA